MSGSSCKTKLPLRKLILQGNDSSYLKLPAGGNSRAPQVRAIRSVAKKLAKVQSFSALKPKLRTLSPHKSVHKVKNSFTSFKFPTSIQTLEADLIEQINNVKSEGFDYISEVYSLAKTAFQKIIEMDAVFGRVLSLIKENYDKYYDALLADLPTYKCERYKFQIDHPCMPEFRIHAHEPTRKVDVPQLKVPLSDSVPEFQQEFMSNFDKFSVSWRKLLLKHKAAC